MLAYRADRGWTQVRLSEESGVSGATIAHIETQANKRPRRITLMRFAQAFGVSLDEFLSDAPPKPVAPLELAPLYYASESERRAALADAGAGAVARYLRDIDGQLDWAERGLGTPEGQQVGNKEPLRRYIYHLLTLRAEAAPDEAAPPPLEEMAAHASVGAGA
jgi:transcriptional regulator with XRE-family HTH domain